MAIPFGALFSTTRGYLYAPDMNTLSPPSNAHSLTAQHLHQSIKFTHQEMTTNQTAATTKQTIGNRRSSDQNGFLHSNKAYLTRSQTARLAISHQKKATTISRIIPGMLVNIAIANSKQGAGA
jgi:hypothetical protein